MKIFVSSTYADLVDHRTAVSEILSRMKLLFAAMEFFGSRADEAVPACKHEIDECNILVGIYAWRYGWQPRHDSPSITEEEFDYARQTGKKCLCYIVDDAHPWPPKMIDQGESAGRLRAFKVRVSTLVRSTFTTPDNLAKQVAADLAREITPIAPLDSFGGLLRVNWEVFSPELQVVLSTAYAQARVDSEDGVVATRHVIAALASVPNTGRIIVTAFPEVPLPKLRDDLPDASVEEMFGYDKPVSSCVLASMDRLLPFHSPTQRLLAIELAVDLLKHGTGSSVADFRRAGIDAPAVDKVVDHIRQVAADMAKLRDALAELSDAEVIHLAYISELSIPEKLEGIALRARVLQLASENRRLTYLAGEIMRRHPKLVTLS